MTTRAFSVGRLGEAVSPKRFDDILLRTMFEFHKWDARCGDIDTLISFPIVLDSAALYKLIDLAELLAKETQAAQLELLRKPHLHRRLGLPKVIVQELKNGALGSSAEAISLLRFDFHWTSDGWKISEANTDVPGGYIESGGFASLMAQEYPSYRMIKDPADVLATVVAKNVPFQGRIALVHATSYTDDRQVMMYLERCLSTHGLSSRLTSPQHLFWNQNAVEFTMGHKREKIDGIIRFFPADWLAKIRPFPRGFFGLGDVLHVNPAMAILTQSKRFPLTWDSLETPLPTWRRLLPETKDPREAPWTQHEEWVVKPVFGREGQDIYFPGITPKADTKRIAQAMKNDPDRWVAQRRFEAIPIASELGALYPCFGVYTVNGTFAGVYGRVSPHALTDDSARDIAIFSEEAPS